MDYDLAGHPASFVTAVIPAEKIGPDIVMYAASACTIVGKNVACWEFLAGEKQQVAELAAFPVQFGKTAAVPVVTANLVASFGKPGESLAPAITAATEAPAPSNSGVSMSADSHTIHDDFVHAKLVLPSYLAQRADAEAVRQRGLAKVDSITPKQAQCVFTPIMTAGLSSDGAVSLTTLHADTKCMGMAMQASELSDFAGGIVTGASKQQRSEFSSPVYFKLAGHDAVFLQGRLFSGTGKVTFLFESCAFFTPDPYCWQGAAPTYKALSDIATTSITFDGQAATTIVPANLMVEPESMKKP